MGCLLLPPPPPPQPTAVARHAIVNSPKNLLRGKCTGSPKNMSPATRPPPLAQTPKFWSAALRGALVETVMVVFPLPFTDVGEKLQVASEGNPEHEAPVKLIVPL
jgi:hypothetical protein